MVQDRQNSLEGLFIDPFSCRQKKRLRAELVGLPELHPRPHPGPLRLRGAVQDLLPLPGLTPPHHRPVLEVSPTTPPNPEAKTPYPDTSRPHQKMSLIEHPFFCQGQEHGKPGSLSRVKVIALPEAIPLSPLFSPIILSFIMAGRRWTEMAKAFWKGAISFGIVSIPF